jgi:hypothetical protein
MLRAAVRIERFCRFTMIGTVALAALFIWLKAASGAMVAVLAVTFAVTWIGYRVSGSVVSSLYQYGVDLANTKSIDSSMTPAEARQVTSSYRRHR